MTAAGDYVFTAANEIDRIGTTCGANVCGDLIVLAGPLLEDVCLSINNLLDIGNPSGHPPVAPDVDSTALFAAGAAPYAYTIGNDSGSANLSGHTAGCFKEDSSGDFYYYQVLIPR